MLYLRKMFCGILELTELEAFKALHYFRVVLNSYDVDIMFKNFMHICAG